MHYLESDADAPYERVFSGNEFDRMPADHSDRFGIFCLRGLGAGVNKRACVKASVFVVGQERGNTCHARALWFARLCGIMAIGG